LRWAEALEQHGGEVRSLFETEFAPLIKRRMMRQAGSALSVAFKDPVLRASGLEGDTYKAVKNFFQLSDGEMHWIVCHCNGGVTVSAATVSARIRKVDGRQTAPGLIALWVLSLSTGAMCALALAAT